MKHLKLAILSILLTLSCSPCVFAEVPGRLWEEVRRNNLGAADLTPALEKLTEVQKVIGKKDTVQIKSLLFQSGEMNNREQNFADALTSFYACLYLSSTPDIVVLERIASVKLKTGDLQGAIKTNQDILLLDPKSTSAYSNLARAYNLFGNYRQALVTLRNNPLQEASDDFSYAMAYYHLNLLDSAKFFIDKELKSDAPYPLALKYAALIYAKAGDKYAACEFTQKAVESIYEGSETANDNSKEKNPLKSWLDDWTRKQIKELKRMNKETCAQVMAAGR
jgi:tetratricopeptide (TPR) repeat protein